jgi:WHEP-TRS domain
MSSAEELSKSIIAKGEEIRLIKQAKPPTMKEDLQPLIAELLALKLSFKEVTGEENGVEKKEEKAKNEIIEKKYEPSKIGIMESRKGIPSSVAAEV